MFRIRLIRAKGVVNMACNKNLQKAKANINHEFYISSSCNLLIFRIDTKNDIFNRDTSEFYKGGGVF